MTAVHRKTAQPRPRHWNHTIALLTLLAVVPLGCASPETLPAPLVGMPTSIDSGDPNLANSRYSAGTYTPYETAGQPVTENTPTVNQAGYRAVTADYSVGHTPPALPPDPTGDVSTPPQNQQPQTSVTNPSYSYQTAYDSYYGSGVREGVICSPLYGCNNQAGWDASQPIPWEVFAQGEYVGPPRTSHVPVYRLRVDDVLEFAFRLTGIAGTRAYRLNVGDTVRVESLTAPNIDREVIVQPDGTITLRQLGQVSAAGRTVEELREDLEKRYKKFILEPAVTVTPTQLNTTLQELRSTVDNRFGAGGQSRRATVTPEGTVQLPAVGSIPAQGLTLDELQTELEERYNRLVSGLEVTPILVQRAPRFVYVVGEVTNSGRYVMGGPTTAIQAISMAGGWKIGAKLNEVVVLRRDENWQLMATKLRLHDAFFGDEPCPDGEIWIRDSDVIIVPKRHIQWTGDLIEMIFTRGVYGVAPIFGSVNVRGQSVL